MKKTEIVIRIAVFSAIIIVVLLQTRVLTRARNSIEAVRKENESLRQQNDTLRALLEEQQGMFKKLTEQAKLNEAALDQLRSANDRLRKKNDELAAKLEGKGTDTASLNDGEAAAHDDGDEEAANDGETGTDEAASEGGMREYLESMLSSPEMRDILRQSIGSGLDLTMKDLFDSLKLTPDELNNFKDMLVDKQMLGMEMGLAQMKSTGTDEEKAKIEEQMKGIGELDENIRGLLGDAQYEEYENYMSTIADRMAISQYKNRLDQSGVAALDERQENELLLALSDERKNFTFSSDFADQNNFSFDRFTPENLEKYSEERQQLADRMIERSKTILTEAQWEQYKTSVENQLKMEKMQMEMAAKLFSGKSNVGEKTKESGAQDNNQDNGTSGETEGNTGQDTTTEDATTS